MMLWVIFASYRFISMLYLLFFFLFISVLPPVKNLKVMTLYQVTQKTVDTTIRRSGTTKKIPLLIIGVSSTSCLRWLHYMLWWHLPTGTSKYTSNGIWRRNKQFVTFRPNSTLETLNANAASMWIKAISSWLCLVLYGWTLIAPVVLRDREFN